ncbi:MAG: hypothetical protein COA79_07055 [Planctomycetota bacterium]|nr:MAG: hypothetical protein COA79_07055 [Planctomycetota bacterium]
MKESHKSYFSDIKLIVGFFLFVLAIIIFDQFFTEDKIAFDFSKITVPMQNDIFNSQGDVTTLHKIVDGKKAILIDFWASWCPPCMSSMSNLIQKEKELAPQGIVVVGMNLEDQKIADSIRVSRNISFNWLVEPADQFYSKLFFIDSIPKMVLISPEGKVLFRGHPEDSELKEILKTLIKK